MPAAGARLPSVPMDLDEAKSRLLDEVDRHAADLLGVSRDIFSHPELCYEEHHAHEVLTRAAEQAGLAVERGAHGLPTAFVARAGRAGPEVAVICEYDALPGLGHACGHNIIAAAGLGAGIGAAALADSLGGRVRVVGTPAEEGGGGKVHLLERGAFDGVDAALVVHPAARDLVEIRAIAVHQLRVTYHGRAAHAAAAPEQGRNALDAAVLGYVNLAALRQHLGPAERVHGIFTEAGDQPNIVPARAAAHWYVRAPDTTSLRALEARVTACLAAGAEAAGCAMELEWIDPAYAELHTNAPLAERYVANAALIGRTVEPAEVDPVVGSTDMGNVSLAVPSIHPMIAVAPPGVAIHTAEFARHAGGEGGDRAVLDGAKVLGMTVLDLWCDDALRRAVRAAFGHTGPTAVHP